ncbi:hypothetical protein SUGI_0137070 [Cryptomeria japonica]|nr:hypothetical protein SUGI_0137070 [Cryptomeria japonica]
MASKFESNKTPKTKNKAKSRVAMNKTTILNPNLDSFNDGLETNEFTNEEHVEGSFGGVVESAYENFHSDDVYDDLDEFISNHVEEFVLENFPLVFVQTSQEFPQEDYMTSKQEDLFGMHVTINDKDKNMHIHGEDIEDSLAHYKVGDMGGIEFDYKTNTLEKDTYEDVSFRIVLPATNLEAGLEVLHAERTHLQTLGAAGELYKGAGYEATQPRGVVIPTACVGASHLTFMNKEKCFFKYAMLYGS